jgi:Ribbon-helix-helix protein, copG family
VVQLLNPMRNEVLIGTQRVTVRLDAKRNARLRRLCEQTGLDQSDVLRRAIDQFTALGGQRVMVAGSASDNTQSSSAGADCAAGQDRPRPLIRSAFPQTPLANRVSSIVFLIVAQI